MLDDLEVDHHIHRRVGQRQLGQISLSRLHPGIAGAHVRNGGLVVVDPDDPAGDAGEQIGAVALAEPGFQHVAAGATLGQPLVDHLVAAKPVVLDVQPGNGALAGQGQLGHAPASRPGRPLAAGGVSSDGLTPVTNALIGRQANP